MKQPFEIFAQVEKETGFGKEILQGRSRNRKRCEARKRFAFLADAEGYSKSSIARHLKRDHTAILYYFRGRV